MEEQTEALNFEEAMQKLEHIVNALQKENLPLQQAMAYFKEGISLSQYCSKTLEEAEETMTKLMNEEGELEDFEPQTKE